MPRRPRPDRRPARRPRAPGRFQVRNASSLPRPARPRASSTAAASSAGSARTIGRSTFVSSAVRVSSHSVRVPGKALQAQKQAAANDGTVRSRLPTRSERPARSYAASSAGSADRARAYNSLSGAGPLTSRHARASNTRSTTVAGTGSAAPSRSASTRPTQPSPSPSVPSRPANSSRSRAARCPGRSSVGKQRNRSAARAGTSWSSRGAASAASISRSRVPAARWMSEPSSFSSRLASWPVGRSPDQTSANAVRRTAGSACGETPAVRRTPWNRTSRSPPGSPAVAHIRRCGNPGCRPTGSPAPASLRATPGGSAAASAFRAPNSAMRRAGCSCTASRRADAYGAGEPPEGASAAPSEGAVPERSAGVPPLPSAGVRLDRASAKD